MAEMKGMDTEQVSALSHQLRSQGESLSGILAGIDNLMHQFGHHWSGPAEAEFMHSWQRTHRPALASVQTAVLGLATSALNNVREQEGASADHGAGGGGGSGGAGGGGNQGVWSPSGGPTQRSQNDRSEILNGTNGRSPEEVRTWWKNLPTSKREEYLIWAPGVLAALPALSPWMAIYRQQPLSQTSLKASGSLKVDVFGIKASGGVDDQLTMTEIAGGGATVTVGAGIFGAVAKEVGGANSGVSVGGKVEVAESKTYSFTSKDEAQAFYDKITRGHPDAIQLVKNINAAEKDGTLNEISQKTSVTGTGSITAEGGSAAMGGSASASASAQMSYDSITHTTTATFGLSGSAVGNIGAYGAHATGEVQASVVSGSNGLQTVVLHGDYNVGTTVGDSQNNVSTGQGGSFTMSIPANADTSRVLTDLEGALSRGDSVAVARDLQSLSGYSTIVTQGDVTGGISTGSAVVWPGAKLETSATTTITTTTSTSIKPSGQYETLPFP